VHLHEAKTVNCFSSALATCVKYTETLPPARASYSETQSNTVFIFMASVNCAHHIMNNLNHYVIADE
jgi:hypothetical protein